MLLLIAGLVLGWAPLVPASLVGLGGLYAAQLRIDDVGLDASAAAVAAGLLVTAELAYWSLEERDRVETEHGESLRRLSVVAFLGVASLLVAEVVMVLSGTVRASGIALDLVGAAAATGALVTIAVLARRGRGR